MADHLTVSADGKWVFWKSDETRSTLQTIQRRHIVAVRVEKGFRVDFGSVPPTSQIYVWITLALSAPGMAEFSSRYLPSERTNLSQTFELSWDEASTFINDLMHVSLEQVLQPSTPPITHKDDEKAETTIPSPTKRKREEEPEASKKAKRTKKRRVTHTE